MVLLFAIILIFLIFSINDIYAQTFESSNNDNYLFLKIFNDKAFALLKIDGVITSIQEEDIKYYKNENFRINFKNKIILHGSPAADSNFINMTIHDQQNNIKITLMIQKLDTNTPYEKPIKLTVLEKFERAEEQTGMKLVIPLEEEKKDIQLVERDIKILTQIPERFPYYQEFFFDVRIVDPALNISNDFWNDVGFLNDVEIISTIKDPFGTILNQFTGNTTGRGHYAPVNGTLFYFNSVAGAYTLEVNATKYFEESATIATDSIIREFFVFTHNEKIKCKFLYDGACLDECPFGLFRLVVENAETCQNIIIN